MAIYNYDDIRLQQELLPKNEGAVSAMEDSDKWEMDTETTLDVMYHSWLGERRDDEGQWVRDRSLHKVMNKKGASFLINEIRPRFNINQQFSILGDSRVKEMVGDTGINIARILQYDYYKYEMDPLYIRNVCDQVTNALHIWLNICLGGGMRTYKGDKTRTIINKQEITGQGGAY